MKFDLAQSTIQLTQDDLISLPDAKGSTVAVLWGSVWLTQDGDPRDHELNAGDSFTIRGAGKVIVSAFENSAVSILHPCEYVVGTPKEPSNADRSSEHGKANHRDGVRYVSSDELEQYKREAHGLRSVYVASMIYSLASAINRSFVKLGDFAAALWLKTAGRRRTDLRNRLKLS